MIKVILSHARTQAGTGIPRRKASSLSIAPGKSAYRHVGASSRLDHFSGSWSQNLELLRALVTNALFPGWGKRTMREPEVQDEARPSIEPAHSKERHR